MISLNIRFNFLIAILAYTTIFSVWSSSVSKSKIGTCTYTRK